MDKNKKDNVIVCKSKNFAIESILLYKFLSENKKEFIISKQFLKSSTSIGANIIEANNAMSKKEFVSKLNISLKEANETQYWLELLFETEYISKEQYKLLCCKCLELIRLLTAIIKTSINNLKK